MRTFGIDDIQEKKIKTWKEFHGCGTNKTAIGGEFTYKFTPTSIGVVIIIKCACGKELDLSEYEKW